MKNLIQRHAAADVGRDVEVFALVNRRLAFVETSLGNDRQRQLRLAHLRIRFSRPAAGATSILYTFYLGNCIAVVYRFLCFSYDFRPRAAAFFFPFDTSGLDSRQQFSIFTALQLFSDCIGDDFICRPVPPCCFNFVICV